MLTARDALFWGVCIPVRIYLATRGDDLALRVLAAVVGARWVLGYENSEVGLFGGRVWWADMRFAHGLHWLAYSVTGNDLWLKSDTVLGAASWFSKEYVMYE